MVIVFDDHAADTPAGKPFAPDTPALEIPVPPVVECVIAVKAVLIHNVGLLEAAPAVLFAVTVIVFVAVLVLLQPPVIV
jgi:hypothetical protein